MKLRRSLIALAVFTLGTVSAAQRDETWIKQRIEQIKDSDTNAWRKVPWTASLLEARRAASARSNRSSCSRTTATSRRAAAETAPAT